MNRIIIATDVGLKAKDIVHVVLLLALDLLLQANLWIHFLLLLWFLNRRSG